MAEPHNQGLSGDKSLLDAALSYAARGLRVLPIETISETRICTCGRLVCASPAKHPIGGLVPQGLKDASDDPAVVARWWTRRPDANVAIATGKVSGLVVIDVDPQHGGAESLADLEATHGPLPRVPTARTGGGGQHLFFACSDDGTEIRNSVSKLGPGIDVRGEEGYAVASPSRHASGGEYSWEIPLSEAPLAPLPHWARATEPPRGAAPGAATTAGLVAEGSRNEHLFRLGCALTARGCNASLIEMTLRTENRERCVPPLSDEEVDRIVAQAVSYPRGSAVGGPPPSSAYSASFAGADDPNWPGPMAAEALHGPAGDFVRMVAPHTEADPQALLLHFLVAFGNLVGRQPHLSVGATRRAGATRHGTNLNLLVVGDTSGGRKGTAHDEAVGVVGCADLMWATDCLVSGLSSGEGLIHEVRDPVTKADKDGNEVITDAGVLDKRRLVSESEFAASLRVAGRDGNTLTAVIRRAWDGSQLRVMTRTSPMKATEAHISIIGHITPMELKQELKATDRANGFANRFLICCSKRSKFLPRGGSLDPLALDPVIDEIREAAKHARAQPLAYGSTDSFWALWDTEYERLSSGRPGLLGALIGRALPTVLRLSLIYAVLDRAGELGAEHLRAALAVWDYCERSVEFIFGQGLGDPVADGILAALWRSRAGLTRTEINDVLGGHRSSAQIEAALQALHRAGRAISTIEKTGGRDSERWFAERK